MARIIPRLTALEVSKISQIGKHAIGDSIYLQVTKANSRTWLLRYSKSGRTTWMGLGSVRVVSLGQAREKGREALTKLSRGIDPLAEKREAKAASIIETTKGVSFEECAQRYIEGTSPSWRNKKHLDQWRNTLRDYAFPIIGAKGVGEIETSHVLLILEPLWRTKTETASRLRGRIEAIISWATVRGYRSGENPARWRGHLDQILPKRTSIQRVKHHSAMALDLLPEFLKELRLHEGNSSLALEFLILTATRTSETLNAKWSEFNILDQTWLIPQARMKAARPHRVPLNPRAIEILNIMQQRSESEFVFPGAKPNKPLSNMALLQLMRKMGRDETPHGFRSTFRDWAAEETSYPGEVAEAALAHVVRDKVEAAYRRGDLFLKRRLMMGEWANFCEAAGISTMRIFGLEGNRGAMV